MFPMLIRNRPSLGKKIRLALYAIKVYLPAFVNILFLTIIKYVFSASLNI